MVVQAAKRRFTVDDYYRMGQAGVLSQDDRVELIEGEIIEMPPIGTGHASRVDRLSDLLWRQIAGRAIVRVQSPVCLGVHSEPQPDLALLRPRSDYYVSAHPGPGDLLLLVEVADTTVAYDREVKVPIYARSGVREVWLVDLPGRAVDVYRDPSPDGYRHVERLGPGQSLSPQPFPDISLPVEDLLL